MFYDCVVVCGDVLFGEAELPVEDLDEFPLYLVHPSLVVSPGYGLPHVRLW